MDIFIFIVLLLGASAAALALFRRRDATALPVRDFDPGPMLADDLNLSWQIRYCDPTGRRTERQITVHSLFGERHPKYAYAHCHLRNDMRHFNLYNVEEATDVETGEVIPVTYGLLDWIEGRK